MEKELLDKSIILIGPKAAGKSTVTSKFEESQETNVNNRSNTASSADNIRLFIVYIPFVFSSRAKLYEFKSLVVIQRVSNVPLTVKEQKVIATEVLHPFHVKQT